MLFAQSASSRSTSKSRCACLSTPTRQPRASRIGTTRSISVVFPLPLEPTKPTAGSCVAWGDSGTGHHVEDIIRVGRRTREEPPMSKDVRQMEDPLGLLRLGYARPLLASSHR